MAKLSQFKSALSSLHMFALHSSSEMQIFTPSINETKEMFLAQGKRAWLCGFGLFWFIHRSKEHEENCKMAPRSIAFHLIFWPEYIYVFLPLRPY